MTLYRATVMDTPTDPFTTDPLTALRVTSDAGILVHDGVIIEHGGYAEVREQHPQEYVVDLHEGVLLPGFVDTHVHFPQVRAIGGLGMPLLDWLDRCALPEEARLADRSYAEQIALEFCNGLIAAGTTTALVFGSHFATAVDALFSTAEASGLRITAGQVLSDRILRPELLTDPGTAQTEGAELITRWHGVGRLRYAVTPRFSLSASEKILDVCAELMDAAPDVWFTSHMNENPAEVDEVGRLFPDARHYLDTYHRHGLVSPRSVLAHNVHASDHELDLLAEVGAWAAHCPTSNAALGSGLFPLRRHVEHGARVSVGSDVGAGTGFFLPKEGLQAYFAQQLLGPAGLALTPAHLLYLITRAGAEALGLESRIGDLSVGKEFDATWLRPQPGSTLEVVLGHAADADDALAKIFALATPADVAGSWAGGQLLQPLATGSARTTPSSPSSPSSSRPQEAA